MTISAVQAFEQITPTLRACEDECSSIPAERVAASLGFQKQKSSNLHVLTNLVFQDEDGSTVTLVERWHDPSGPCQNLPDIYRLRLTLNVIGRPPVEHMAEYEG